MSAVNGESIHETGELQPGDEVQAWRHGTLLHRGIVTDTAPALGLLWIRDTLDGGGRKLLELAEFEILRASEVPERGGEAVKDVG